MKSCNATSSQNNCSDGDGLGIQQIFMVKLQRYVQFLECLHLHATDALEIWNLQSWFLTHIFQSLSVAFAIFSDF